MEKVFKYNCEQCDFHCNAISTWEKHTITTKHQTGKKKIRSDYKGGYKCEICEYKTENKTSFKQHTLNDHATKEQRESEFKFYCKTCDYGTFSKDLYERHNMSDRHKKRIENYK
jgi:hypothetical protein